MLLFLEGEIEVGIQDLFVQKVGINDLLIIYKETQGKSNYIGEGNKRGQFT
jgi:hypothetical protein